MSTRRLSALAALALLGTTGVHGQSSQLGTVYRLHVRASDGLTYFYVEGDRSARPACATQPYWVITNEATPSGKQQLALLLLAESTGRTVTVYGNGTCSRWPDGEDVREIALTN